MDALVNGLQAAAQALLWWNPAVWWLNRRIREEREFCCDDLVLSQGIASGEAYSRTLVNVAERVSLPASSWAMAGMADNFGAIDRRVRRALEGGHGRRGRGRYGALAVLLLVAGWVLPGATDGEEKEFDAIEAAKVETAFRINDMKSEHVGCHADGIPLRSGELAFVVQSITPELPGLQVTAKGEFSYPNAEGEAAKCVVTGEIKATYRDMSITASRLAFSRAGVLEFRNAMTNMNGPEGLTAEKMILDLRDGVFAMENGKADQVNVEGAQIVSDSVPKTHGGSEQGHGVGKTDETASVDPGKQENSEASIPEIQFSDFTQDGPVTRFNDIDFTLNLGEVLGDIRLKAKKLEHTKTGDDAGRMLLQGDVEATFFGLAVTADTLLVEGRAIQDFQFYKAVVVSADYGTVSAEQVFVDVVGRKLRLLNGTVDEARLKAALGEDAKNAPDGEWLTLPFAVVRQVMVTVWYLELDVSADVLPGHEMKLADLQGTLIGSGTADQMVEFKKSYKKAIDNGQAKYFFNAALLMPLAEAAFTSVGNEAPETEEEVSKAGTLSVRAKPVKDIDGNAHESFSVDLEIERKALSKSDSDDSIVEKDMTSFTVPLQGSVGEWYYHVKTRTDTIYDLVVVRPHLI